MTVDREEPVAGETAPRDGGATEDTGAEGQGSFTFDRHLVLEQLGGWRGMVDASLPTIAFIVANTLGGLWAGIWGALGTAFVLFVVRLARRETVPAAAFAYGRLHAHEERRAELAVERFKNSWRNATKKSLRAWMN